MMRNSEKILRILSDVFEKGILTSQDSKKEIINSLKFKRDDVLDKLKIVSVEEFEVLKKIVQKQGEEIKKLKKNESLKRQRNLNLKPLIINAFM